MDMVEQKSFWARYVGFVKRNNDVGKLGRIKNAIFGGKSDLKAKGCSRLLLLLRNTKEGK